MDTKQKYFVFYLALLICFKTFGQENVIKEISITGNKRIEKAAILSKIKSAVSTTLDRDVIRSDILAINALGYFENINVYEEPYDGGINLIYEVKEKPIVSEIKFEGLSELDESEAKSELEIKQYEILDIVKLNKSVQKLQAKYEEKGFYLADIRYEIDFDEKKGESKVVFYISENDKIKVKTINIIGNSVISDDELKKIMQTQEGGFFSWLSGSGSFREMVLERDMAAMSFYYGTKGYVRAVFSKPIVTVSPDKKWIYITFNVDEGKKYRVGKVDFSGDLVYSLQDLYKDLQLKEGDIFNTEILRRETLRYTDMYSDIGYAFANVIPQPNIHDDTLTVDVDFEIDKGQRVYIGNITITGNTKTKDKVIRRELLIHEGELYNGTRKRLSRENVLRLGFFDNVEFHQSVSRNDQSVVNIEIRVTERSTGQFVISAGYASGDYGFTASAQLSQNNFLGNGQVASLSANIITGIKQYEYSLSFTEPYLGSSLWSLGGDLYQLRRIVRTFGADTFNEVKTGFDVKLGHPIFELTNLYLTYKLENSYVDPNSIIDTTIIPPDSVNGYSSSITGSVIYDKRDDRLDPRNGWFWRLSSEFAGLGGSRKFIRSSTEIRFFAPLFWQLVFRSMFRVGNISAMAGKDIPVNEYYILGGLFSLRGYETLSIGPKATLSSQAKSLAGKEIVIGGTNEALLTLETEFPILTEARIRGVVFFDAGNAFGGPYKNTGPLIYANYGIGLRWFTPVAPLRFEFGWPIVDNGEGLGCKFFFTIGPPF